jgi:hypothetical protein
MKKKKRKEDENGKILLFIEAIAGRARREELHEKCMRK